MREGDFRIFHFDTPEARGTIDVERDSYGVTIRVDGRPLLAIDLFHQSATQGNAAKYPQAVIYDHGAPEGDPVGYVCWLDDAKGKHTSFQDLGGQPVFDFPTQGIEEDEQTLSDVNRPYKTEVF